MTRHATESLRAYCDPAFKRKVIRAAQAENRTEASFIRNVLALYMARKKPKQESQ